ncbi:MAG: YraN family protein [Methylococcaceae bacterium]|nr:YraN family protein [Methylococcaceae bacterium]MDD1610236.1 YraN family protein [Methylococcaceae bacterium]MDD1616267.1 YraN family protein [Methylococcaceae bacterium]OYV18097.1 MAG: putative endonuclease [Methylococcaceae bacterium NSP1-2]
MLFSTLKTKAAHLLRGESAEQQAHEFLLKKGLKPIARNFRCKQGELDLIMTDKQTLVIVEVRFRQTDKYGSAAESVTRSKQLRIIAATQVYLSTQKLNTPIRFDVVALSGNGKVDWIQNAF